jgi:hypothetical protein
VAFVYPVSHKLHKGKSERDPQIRSVGLGKNGVCGDTNPVPIWTSVGIGYKNKNNNYANYAKLVNTVNSCSERPS